MLPDRFRTHNLSGRAAVNLRLRPRGHWDRHYHRIIWKKMDIYFGTMLKISAVRMQAWCLAFTSWSEPCLWGDQTIAFLSCWYITAQDGTAHYSVALKQRPCSAGKRPHCWHRQPWTTLCARNDCTFLQTSVHFLIPLSYDVVHTVPVSSLITMIYTQLSG